jgi:hypothetical protein
MDIIVQKLQQLRFAVPKEVVIFKNYVLIMKIFRTENIDSFCDFLGYGTV